MRLCRMEEVKLLTCPRCAEERCHLENVCYTTRGWILLQQGEKPQRVPEKWGVVVQYHSLSQNTALN